MRLIWLSKIVSGSTVWPDVALSQSEKRTFASRFAARNACRKTESRANGLRSRSWFKSVIQLSQIAAVITRARLGFDWSSQRRGVTPLVLLLKRSGNVSASSFTVVVRNNFE